MRGGAVAGLRVAAGDRVAGALAPPPTAWIGELRVAVAELRVPPPRGVSFMRFTFSRIALFLLESL